LVAILPSAPTYAGNPSPTPAWPKAVTSNDLSGKTAEEITVVAQNDAIAFHKVRSGLGRDSLHFSDQFASDHNLRGKLENLYAVEFTEAYQALEPAAASAPAKIKDGEGSGYWDGKPFAPGSTWRPDAITKYGTVVGEQTAIGVHMKPGYEYHWETIYVTDDAGYVRAKRHLYLTYYGKRVTD
jgi:hypothetical protein